jgi:hypothetical protein
MATFKIRDLMVAIRPGLLTPQRPVALEDCDPVLGSIICAADPQTGGGCDGGSGGCDDTCGPCTGCTETCGACTGCTDTCGPCSGACTQLPCTVGCTATCGACTDGCTNTNTCGASGGGCGIYTETCGFTPCARSIKPPVIGRMSNDELAKLKSQLRGVLQQVSRRASVLAAAEERAALIPQTLAEVDALEQKLSEAMDELRARRTQIQNAAGSTAETKGTGDKR